MQCYNEKGEPIKVCNKDGEEICVMSTIQATHEAAQEYRRAERYRIVSIIELIIIVVVVISRVF